MQLTDEQVTQAIADAADNTPDLDGVEPDNVPPDMNEQFVMKFGITLDQVSEITEALGSVALEGLKTKWMITSVLGLRTQDHADKTIRAEMYALSMSSIIVGIELGKTLGQSA